MTQNRHTQNVRVTMKLAECEHQAVLFYEHTNIYCPICKMALPSRFVGNILVSLDKDGFLETALPLKVR